MAVIVFPYATGYPASACANSHLIASTYASTYFYTNSYSNSNTIVHIKHGEC
jgi:hypothetical protein